MMKKTLQQGFIEKLPGIVQRVVCQIIENVCVTICNLYSIPIAICMEVCWCPNWIMFCRWVKTLLGDWVKHNYVWMNCHWRSLQSYFKSFTTDFYLYIAWFLYFLVYLLVGIVLGGFILFLRFDPTRDWIINTVILLVYVTHAHN